MVTSNIPWTEIGIFWTSIAIAFITVTATVFNYLLFRTQIDPEVIVYATLDENRPSLILLIIENIGRGLAKNVSFTYSRPVPKEAFGFENALLPKTMDFGPLINGIPSLGPGAKRIITWGQYGGLERGLGTDVIEVTASYFRGRIILPGRKALSTTSFLDIKSFEGTDASDKNWDKKAVEQLGKISKTLDHAASGFKALKIEVVNMSELQEANSNKSAKKGQPGHSLSEHSEETEL